MEEIFHLNSSNLLRARTNTCFIDVKRKLRLALPASTQIEHVGATAIKHCRTKGDLDLLVRVNELDFVRSEQTLKKMFKQNVGSFRSADFSAFESLLFNVPVGVQLTVKDGPLDFFLCFRDKLNASSALVANYNRMKQRCVGQRMERYRKEKSRFIASVLRRGNS